MMSYKSWQQNVLPMRFYDNTVDALTPQFWARESLLVLIEKLLYAMLVYRDFENEVARYGDVVNTRIPAEFVAIRKTNSDPVTIQNATLINVPVTLNQHAHTSFMIKDGEESLAMESLVDLFINPAVRSLGKMVDQCLASQFVQFLNYTVGQLGTLDSTTARSALTSVRRGMNSRSVPDDGRNIVLTVDSESEMLNTDLFIQAQQVGDDGTALERGKLGTKFGLDTYYSVNQPLVQESNTTKTAAFEGAINRAAGYGKGTAAGTTLAVDGITGAYVVGAFITIDKVPYRVVSHTETTGNTTAITVDRALSQDVADNAVIEYYTTGTVNFSGGYLTKWAKKIVYAGTPVPQVGQMVSFGSSGITYGSNDAGGPGGTPIYVVIQVDTANNTIVLDRPLEADVADTTVINWGPGGDYNFAFIRNAMALVSRPLAPPRAGTGALSAVANYQGLAMRATITYDGTNQGHLVTLDLLFGVKVLNSRMGEVLLG